MAYTLAGFRRRARRFRNEDGSPLRIEAFQARALADHFAGVPETVIVIPEGNGKTTLLAALGLYHLEEWIEGDPFVPIFASAREQAGILFEQAAGLVERSELDYPENPDGIFEVKRGYRIIRLRKNRRAYLMVKASDERTSDGVIPTLGLVDEYHRHRNDGAYSTVQHKLGKRDGRMVTISTAGAHIDSPLGELRQVAHELPGFVRKGTYNHVVTPEFAWHEWCLTDDQNLDNLRMVKRANPASFVTLDSLRRKRNSPSHRPGRWARFACGVWTEGEDPWIDPQIWDSSKVDVGGVQDGDEVWVAVRTGQQGGSGIGIASPRGDGVAVRAEILPYDFPGLEFALRRLDERYAVRGILVDERQFGIGAQVLEASGLPLDDVPQTPQRLMQATATFLSLMSSGRISHDGDSDLRAQVMAGRVKETTTGAYLEPTARTSALIAVVVAAHKASLGSPDPLVVLPSVG